MVATGLGAELVVLDGSGAALPPVAADSRLLVASAAQPIPVTAGYLNTYRARIADLVVVTMAEDDAPHEELRDALREHVRPWTPIIRTVCGRGRSSRSTAGAWRSSARRLPGVTRSSRLISRPCTARA